MKLSTFNKDILKTVTSYKVRQQMGSFFREICPFCNLPKGEHEWDDLDKNYQCPNTCKTCVYYLKSCQIAGDLVTWCKAYAEE